MHHAPQRGITLIETIVAVSILALAVVGPMTLAALSLRASRDARSELIATHLAEEGIEVIRSVRDNNSAQDTDVPSKKWINTIKTTCKGKGCVIDVTDHSAGVWGNNTLVNCTGAVCNESALYYNPATGLYRQATAPLASPWTLSPFTRVIVVEEISNETPIVHELRIHATVTYRSFGGNIRTITVSDAVYNWFPSLLP